MVPAGTPLRRSLRRMWVHGVGGATSRDPPTPRRPEIYEVAAIDAMGGPVEFWLASSYGGDRSSLRLATIQTLRRSYTSLHLRSMKGRAVRRSKRPSPKPPRHSNRITMEIGGSNRTILLRTSRRIFPPAQAHFHGYSAGCRSRPIHSTHKVTNPAWKNKPTFVTVVGRGRPVDQSPQQERMMAKRANAKTVEVNSSHVAYMSQPERGSQAHRRSWLPPHTPTSNSSAKGEQNEKESKMKPTQTGETWHRVLPRAQMGRRLVLQQGDRPPSGAEAV